MRDEEIGEKLSLWERLKLLWNVWEATGGNTVASLLMITAVRDDRPKGVEIALNCLSSHVDEEYADMFSEDMQEWVQRNLAGKQMREAKRTVIE